MWRKSAPDCSCSLRHLQSSRWLLRILPHTGWEIKWQLWFIPFHSDSCFSYLFRVECKSMWTVRSNSKSERATSWWLPKTFVKLYLCNYSSRLWPWITTLSKSFLGWLHLSMPSRIPLSWNPVLMTCSSGMKWSRNSTESCPITLRPPYPNSPCSSTIGKIMTKSGMEFLLAQLWAWVNSFIHQEGLKALTWWPMHGRNIEPESLGLKSRSITCSSEWESCHSFCIPIWSRRFTFWDLSRWWKTAQDSICFSFKAEGSKKWRCWDLSLFGQNSRV